MPVKWNYFFVSQYSCSLMIPSSRTYPLILYIEIFYHLPRDVIKRLALPVPWSVGLRVPDSFKSWELFWKVNVASSSSPSHRTGQTEIMIIKRPDHHHISFRICRCGVQRWGIILPKATISLTFEYTLIVNSFLFHYIWNQDHLLFLSFSPHMLLLREISHDYLKIRHAASRKNVVYLLHHGRPENAQIILRIRGFIRAIAVRRGFFWAEVCQRRKAKRGTYLKDATEKLDISGRGYLEDSVIWCLFNCDLLQRTRQ